MALKFQRSIHFSMSWTSLEWRHSKYGTIFILKLVIFEFCQPVSIALVDSFEIDRVYRLDGVSCSIWIAAVQEFSFNIALRSCRSMCKRFLLHTLMLGNDGEVEISVLWFDGLRIFALDNLKRFIILLFLQSFIEVKRIVIVLEFFIFVLGFDSSSLKASLTGHFLLISALCVFDLSDDISSQALNQVQFIAPWSTSNLYELASTLEIWALSFVSEDLFLTLSHCITMVKAFSEFCELILSMW